MRIAVIAADLLPERLGGAEVHLVELMKRLADKRHTFDVFVGASAEIVKTFPKNVTVHPVRYPKIPNLYGISYILFSPSQIKKALRDKKIDLVWAKQVFPQGVVAAILAKYLRKPLYMTAQNPLDYKEELVIKGPIPFKTKLPEILTPLIQYALRSADVVAAVSTYAKIQSEKLGTKKVVVIPNGVDTAKFKVKSEKFKIGKRFKIVTTSALIPRNGLDTLIDAVALLPKSLNWELIIAGEGTQEKNLKSQISNLKLEKKIKLIGRVENYKIPQLLAGSDLFVRLSRAEGFGVSFLEAMAAGVPVIATQVGGITDFVENKQTGILVNPDSPKEAASAIEKLINDNDLYRTIQRNANDLVRKRYSWEGISRRVEEEFRSLTKTEEGRGD